MGAEDEIQNLVHAKHTPPPSYSLSPGSAPFNSREPGKKGGSGLSNPFFAEFYRAGLLLCPFLASLSGSFVSSSLLHFLG